MSQSSQGISWTWAGSVFHLPHFIHTHYSTMISHCIHVYHSRQPESLFMTLCNIWSLGLREAQFWGWLVMADLHEHPCCSNICKCLQKLLTCSRQRSWQHGPHRSLACLVVRDFNHKLPQYWWSNVHQVRFLQVLRSVNHVYWSENMQQAESDILRQASCSALRPTWCTSKNLLMPITGNQTHMLLNPARMEWQEPPSLHPWKAYTS